MRNIIVHAGSVDKRICKGFIRILNLFGLMVAEAVILINLLTIVQKVGMVGQSIQANRHQGWISKEI